MKDDTTIVEVEEIMDDDEKYEVIKSAYAKRVIEIVDNIPRAFLGSSLFLEVGVPKREDQSIFMVARTGQGCFKDKGIRERALTWMPVSSSDFLQVLQDISTEINRYYRKDIAHRFGGLTGRGTACAIIYL